MVRWRTGRKAEVGYVDRTAIVSLKGAADEFGTSGSIFNRLPSARKLGVVFAPSMSKRPRKNRKRRGRAAPIVAPTKSVFINCPYDKEFIPLFDAIMLATVCCGFLPRSALESGTVAKSRMDRIAEAVFDSEYSIHDLSRCKGEGNENLARFNMPLELGIAMGFRFAAASEDERHDWLVLVRKGHPYTKVISDLAGFDPEQHDGTEEEIVRAVMRWLVTRDDAIEATPQRVLEALPRFLEKKSKLAKQWGEIIPWVRLVQAAREVVPSPE